MSFLAVSLCDLIFNKGHYNHFHEIFFFFWPEIILNKSGSPRVCSDLTCKAKEWAAVRINGQIFRVYGEVTALETVKFAF